MFHQLWIDFFYLLGKNNNEELIIIFSEEMEKGDLYEKYIYAKLHKSGEYKWIYTIAEIPLKLYFKLGPVQSFEDLLVRYQSDSKGKICDRGFDIVAKNDCLIAIQCKHYNRPVGPDDLGGFSTLILVCRERVGEKVKGRVYASNGFTKPLLLNYKGSQAVELVTLPMDEISNIELSKKQNQILRDYQIEAINIIVKKLKESGSCTLCLPCGTGKTFISFEVIKKMGIQTYYFAPLIVNVEHLYDRYDGSKSMFHSRCHRNKDGEVIFICQKSAEYFVKDIKPGSLVIFDESHDLNTGEEAINAIINSGCYLLMISATPRELYGDKVMTISYKEAIERKIINDFRIYIPILSEWAVNPYTEMEFLLWGMRLLGKRKCIVYCLNKEHLHSLKSEIKDEEFQSRIITEETTNREEILKEFEESEARIILFSIRILDQCVDLVKCDSIFLTRLTKNKIRSVQRISRCTRFYPGKAKSAVFCYSKEHEEILDFLDSLKETELEIEGKIHCLSLDKKHTYESFKRLEKEERERIKESVLLGFKKYNKEKYEFMALKRRVQKRVFDTMYPVDEYEKMAKENSWELCPDKKYKKFWKGWYEFLGIDDSRFPQSLEDFKKYFIEHEISNLEEYYDRWKKHGKEIPSQPQYYYEKFDNMVRFFAKKNEKKFQVRSRD